MKKVTIKQNKEFNKQIGDILLSKGAVKGICDYDSTRNTYRLVGEFNSFTFLMDDNVGSQCFSIFGKFNNPNSLTTNCKFNFHDGGTDVNQSIFRFMFHLQTVINHLN